MKKIITIEWRHLDLNSVTCTRCEATGVNIKDAIEVIKSELGDNAEIIYKEIKLNRDQIKESNLVLINDVPIENLLKGATASENECSSCCDILEEKTCCRTIVEDDGTVNEEISKDLILKAIYSIINKKEEVTPCCCKSDQSNTSCCSPNDNKLLKKLSVIGLSFIFWIILYLNLVPLSKFFTYSLLSINKGTHLGEAVEFFLLDVPKVLMLLILIVFIVGIIRSFFTPERTRKILAGKSEFIGNVLASLLGIVTPFCSCSAVPLFIGFVSAGIPLGVTFSFLISAPMINEIALVLLYGMFGLKVALIYLFTGLFIAIVSGWIIGRLKMENYIEEWVRESSSPKISDSLKSLTWLERINYGVQSVKDIVGKVWPYVIFGIAIGAGIHGYVPQDFMASIMGSDAWWSVPLAVIIGVPLYSNAAGILPIVHALLEKGAALGTALAFMMAVIGLSLPETIILRKVLKPQLIAVFLGVVATGILIIGYIFNMLF